MKPANIFVVMGQGGQLWSRGIMSLHARLAAHYPDLDVELWRWLDHREIVSRITEDRETKRNVLIGYSLGANAITWVAADLNALGAKVDLLVGYDPTVHSILSPIGSNVKKAVCYVQTNPLQIFGKARWTGNVEIVETRNLHILVQSDENLHRRTFQEINNALG